MDHIAFLTALALSACPAFAQVASVQDLGTVSTFFPVTNTPLAISADGSTVVGFENDGTGFKTAFRWKESAGFEALLHPGANSSSAFFASDDGNVVAGTAFPGGNVVWDAMGQSVEITTPGFQDASITGISGDGSTVFGLVIVPFTLVKGFVWTTASGFQLVGTFGGSSSNVRAVSIDGQVVVGGALDGNGLSRVFRWTPQGGLQDTGVPPRATYPYLTVSADGNTVAGYTPPQSAGSRAFIWNAASGYTELGSPGAVSLVDIWLSEDGSVLMGNADVGSGVRGFRWTTSSGFDWLDAPGGFYFTVWHMSADGSAAIGGTGSPQAVYWTLGGGTSRCRTLVPHRHRLDSGRSARTDRRRSDPCGIRSDRSAECFGSLTVRRWAQSLVRPPRPTALDRPGSSHS